MCYLARVMLIIKIDVRDLHEVGLRMSTLTLILLVAVAFGPY